MIAVDANVFMELLEKRKHVDTVRTTLGAYTDQHEKIALSSLSVSHIFYLAEAHKIPMNSVERLIFTYELFDITVADVGWALAHYHGRDFEDALQIGAALREKVTAFLTLDVELASKFGNLLDIQLIGA